MFFISSLLKKLILFSRYLNICLDFLVMQKKQFDWKDKVNFKIYDITKQLANNYSKHIVQYLMKQRQAMKFRPLIEYNKRNNFFQKVYRK